LVGVTCVGTRTPHTRLVSRSGSADTSPLNGVERVDSIHMAMRLSTLGNGLVIAGGAVAVATVTAIATGTEIVLTPAMVQLIIYKGLAAAAIGLIIAGSWIGRRGRQLEQAARSDAPDTPELEAGIPPLQPGVPKSADPARDTIRSSRSG